MLKKFKKRILSKKDKNFKSKTITEDFIKKI